MSSTRPARISRVAWLAIFLPVVAACTSAQGGVDQSCYPNGTCNTGLSCLSNVCVDANVDSGTNDASAAQDVEAGQGTDSSKEASGPFTPASLAGLVLWTSGTSLADAGTTVSVWADQSGKGHDMTVPPAEFAPTRDPAAIGGRDALKFDALSSSSLTSPKSQDFVWATDNFVVEIVAAPGACDTNCDLWSYGFAEGGVFLHAQIKTQGGQSPTLNTGLGIFTAGQYDGVNPPLSAGAHVIGLRRTSATAAEARVDGTATPIALSTAYSVASGSFVFGYNGLNGDIAEFVVVHDPTDADVTQLEAYLKSKYAL